MLQKKRKGRLQKGIMVAVSALTVLASASTALAYQPMQSSDMSVGNVLTEYTVDTLNFEPVFNNPADFDFSKSDKIFLNLDGTYEFVYDDTVDSHAL